MGFNDDWPIMADGSHYDGKQLLRLVRCGESPFKEKWDVNLLIQEVEEALKLRVVDIPSVSEGSNNYGFHIKLSDGSDTIARLARDDVNNPDFAGWPFSKQVPETEFEAATYELLRLEPGIMVSWLLHYRLPIEHPPPRTVLPQDIAGRRMMVFRKAEGQNNRWRGLSTKQQTRLLTQSADIRAALFNYELPLEFAATWLRERLFEQKPESIPVPVAPTLEFCEALLTSKIGATIQNLGDVIGWESDNVTVGPEAFAAKQSLLRLVPHIMPPDQDQIYRLVLEHGDFGIHNMSITMDTDDLPKITSLYDWETGCIVPAILSDPLMALTVDLVVDEAGSPSVIRIDDDSTPEDRVQYDTWSKHYFEILFGASPRYKAAIQSARDIRHIWRLLREWRGVDPEGYFGQLGDWAENRIHELGVA